MQNEGNTQSASRPRWSELILNARTTLRENQTEFGKRFNVSHAAVSDWERGVTDPPAEVVWWVLHDAPRTTKGARK